LRIFSNTSQQLDHSFYTILVIKSLTRQPLIISSFLVHLSNLGLMAPFDNPLSSFNSLSLFSLILKIKTNFNIYIYIYIYIYIQLTVFYYYSNKKKPIIIHFFFHFLIQIISTLYYINNFLLSLKKKITSNIEERGCQTGNRILSISNKINTIHFMVKI
jgi:hypothetical protein